MQAVSCICVGQGWRDRSDKDSGKGVGRFQHPVQWPGLRLHSHQAHSRQEGRRQHAGVILVDNHCVKLK